jgi:hypothetical protein
MPVTNLLSDICGEVEAEEERILMKKYKHFLFISLYSSLVMDEQASGFVESWLFPSPSIS